VRQLRLSGPRRSAHTQHEVHLLPHHRFRFPPLPAHLISAVQGNLWHLTCDGIYCERDGTAAWVAIATAPDARLRGFCHFDAESRHSSVYLADNCLEQDSGGADKFAWGRVSLSTQIHVRQMLAQVLTILAPEQVTLDNHPCSFPVF